MATVDLSPLAIKGRFDAALAELNFGQRWAALGNLGRELKSSALTIEQRTLLLEGLTPPSGSTFVERARLLVARHAECPAIAKRLLDHRSQSVRSAACGLLAPADAREAYLSASSSRQLRSWLVRSPQLPCDEEVLQLADRLFNAEVVWQVLLRTEDETLLRAWMDKLGRIISWAGLMQLAPRFPDCVLERFTKDAPPVSHDSLLLLARVRPKPLLRWAFREGSLPCTKLAHWGWRHHPTVMFEICKENALCSCHWTPHKLATALMELPKRQLKGSSWYLTPNVKIGALVSIVTEFPEAMQTPAIVLSFINLFPDGIAEHRTKEIRSMVAGFWKIIAEMGRPKRNDFLVGGSMDIFRSFALKLPPTVAVEQFFTILDEFEVDAAMYRFVLNGICKTEDGRHDDLILRVFRSYLLKERESATDIVKMFQVLLADAKSMDVLQSAFDALLIRLGHRTELGLLHSVVSRMKQLDLASKRATKQMHFPKSNLPLPMAWVDFVDPSCIEAVPHVAFLHLVLQSGSGPSLLGAGLQRFETGFFWDTFEHVLAHAGSSSGRPLEAIPATQLHVFEAFDVAAIARVGVKRAGTGTLAGGVDRPSVYFDLAEGIKKDTFAKCGVKREHSYASLCQLALDDVVPAKAFDDLIPFLVTRLVNEQPNIRNAINVKLLRGHNPALPHRLWVEKLELLKNLWSISSKPRMRGTGWQETWAKVGRKLIELELSVWRDGAPPSDACLFGLEVAQTAQSCSESDEVKLNLPACFAECSKNLHKGVRLSDSAAKWVFETAVPLPGASGDQNAALKSFWRALKTMSQVVDRAEPAERALWERWLFVRERWAALLSGGVTQLAMDFVLVGVVQLVIGLQPQVSSVTTGKKDLWWEPLECSAYKKGVHDVLSQLEAGEIPAYESSKMLVQRIKALASKGVMTRDASSDLPTLQPCVDWAYWTEKWYHNPPIPRKLHFYHDDNLGVLEANTLSKLLLNGKGDRRILWQVVDIASVVSGRTVSQLVENAVMMLDARLEGMARCVELQYPYLKSALAREGQAKGSCDVLTPLLEMWLADDATRDERCGKLMARKDFECFLFFGDRFAEHLSMMRQEWLHRCLLKVDTPGGTERSAEFYHYTDLVPSLARVALLGPGWRSCHRPHDPQCREPKGIQTQMWHPDTQTEFLRKGLVSTSLITLAIIPCLDYADGLKRAQDILSSYPKEQTGPVDDVSGWAVIQPSGVYSDIASEIRRRFLELEAPGVHNAVSHPEVEQLLVGLGRADDALGSLKVVGQYAGDFKRAKDAVAAAVPNLSLSQAREVIREVMFGPKGGVSLQVAGLRLIADLQIPGPLELYRAAWRDGQCHRDVAANILAKVATTPPTDWKPDDVKDFFDFFEFPDREDVYVHVADLFLDHLRNSPKWFLPFLPGVVLKLVTLPRVTAKAVQALWAAREHVTEVVSALASLIMDARLAAIAQSVAHTHTGPEGIVLKDLGGYYHDSFDLTLSAVIGKRLDECDARVLCRFLEEVLQKRDESQDQDGLTRSAFKIWAELLRPCESAAWSGVMAWMETAIIQRGRLQDLDLFGATLVARVSEMKLSVEERAKIIALTCNLFERVLDDHLALDEGDVDTVEADNEYRTRLEDRRLLAERLIIIHWAGLLARGCSDTDIVRLFARCPSGRRAELTTAIVAHDFVAHDVATRALSWFIAPCKAREKHYATLVHLWPKVAAWETERAGFDKVVALLGSPAPCRAECVALIEGLLKLGPCEDVIRAALEWLGHISPRDAARLWPALFAARKKTGGGPTGAADIEALLALCEAASVSPPAIPLRECSDDVLEVLATSTLPAARVLAVQALQELRAPLSAAQLATLEALCADASAVVRVAASHLRALRQPAAAAAAAVAAEDA